MKLPFVSGQKNQPEEDERLMQLFRNRAGLKKAHAGLQDQLYEFKDKLKQQEAATSRAKEQLESLEMLLGNPESGYGALVFFQLRGLWRSCYLQLEQFSAELERQQEERERRKQVDEFNSDHERRLDTVDERISAAEAAEGSQTETLNALQEQHRRLRGFWNYFRRRRLLAQIEEQRVRHARAAEDTAAVRAERGLLEKEQCPPFPGLSVDGRRAINMAVIAYALVLSARLSVNGLASKAKDAVVRRVNDAQYGTRTECEALMSAIAQAQAIVKSRKDLAAEIKRCVESLREVAQYRTDNETVPLGDTLGAVVPQVPGGGRTVMLLSAPQILADDYWNIYKVLLR